MLGWAVAAPALYLAAGEAVEPKPLLMLLTPSCGCLAAWWEELDPSPARALDSLLALPSWLAPSLSIRLASSVLI